MKRIATPSEFRGPAIFLLSNASSFCTGSDLRVDGGVSTMVASNCLDLTDSLIPFDSTRRGNLAFVFFSWVKLLLGVYT